MTVTNRQNKKPKWRNSPAQVFLYNGLKDGTIPMEGMPPKEVYEKFCKDQPAFKEFGDELFGSRLRSLREKVSDKKSKATRDALALEADRLVHPRPTHDGYGMLFWPDSEAKELLATDIDNGKLLYLSKEALWSTRKEYYENFPQDLFIKHVFQELKSRKFKRYVEDQRQKKRNVA